MAYMAKRQEGKFERTPFVSEMVDDMQIKPKVHAFAKKSSYANLETGEMETAVVGFRKEIDSSSFVKIYAEGIKAIFGLPPAAINVLAVLLSAYRSKNTLGTKGDRIYISFRSACMDHGYSYKQATWINGINHLICNSFIAQSVEPNQYFVNGAFFFKGDRFRFVQEYYRDASQLTDNSGLVSEQ